MELTYVDPSEVTTRTTASVYDPILQEIVSNPEHHEKIVKLDEFTAKGKASTERSKLTQKYGTKPDVAGFTFIVSQGRLLARFDKSQIVSGAAEEHRAKIAAQKEAAKVKKASGAEAETPQFEIPEGVPSV